MMSSPWNTTIGLEKPISELHLMLKTAEKTIPRKTPKCSWFVKRKSKRRNNLITHKLERAKGRKLFKLHHHIRRRKLLRINPDFSMDSLGSRKGIVLNIFLGWKKRRSGKTLHVYLFSWLKWDLLLFHLTLRYLALVIELIFIIHCRGSKRRRSWKRMIWYYKLEIKHRLLSKLYENYDLCLPSGLYLSLSNVCLITSITRNIISFSCLRKFGFSYQIVDGNIHSFLNGVFYVEARTINGIHELNINDTSYNKSLYHVNDGFWAF